MRAFPEADAPDASGWAYVRNKVADGVRRKEERAMRYAVNCKELEIKTRNTPTGPRFFDVVSVKVISRLSEGQMVRSREAVSMCTFMYLPDAENFIRAARLARAQKLETIRLGNLA